MSDTPLPIPEEGSTPPPPPPPPAASPKGEEVSAPPPPPPSDPSPEELAELERLKEDLAKLHGQQQEHAERKKKLKEVLSAQRAERLDVEQAADVAQQEATLRDTTSVQTERAERAAAGIAAQRAQHDTAKAALSEAARTHETLSGELAVAKYEVKAELEQGRTSLLQARADHAKNAAKLVLAERGKRGDLRSSLKDFEGKREGLEETVAEKEGEVAAAVEKIAARHEEECTGVQRELDALHERYADELAKTDTLTTKRCDIVKRRGELDAETSALLQECATLQRAQFTAVSTQHATLQGLKQELLALSAPEALKEVDTRLRTARSKRDVALRAKKCALAELDQARLAAELKAKQAVSKAAASALKVRTAALAACREASELEAKTQKELAQLSQAHTDVYVMLSLFLRWFMELG